MHLRRTTEWKPSNPTVPAGYGSDGLRDRSQDRRETPASVDGENEGGGNGRNYRRANGRRAESLDGKRTGGRHQGHSPRLGRQSRSQGPATRRDSRLRFPFPLFIVDRLQDANARLLKDAKPSGS